MRFFFTLSFLFFLSCNTSKKINEYESFSSQLMESASNSFPIKDKETIEKSSFMIIHYPDAISINKFCGVIIGNSYSNEEFQQQKNHIESDYEKIIPSKKYVKYIPNNEAVDFNDIVLPNVKDSIIVSRNFLSDNVTFYKKEQTNGRFLNGDNSQYYNTSKNLNHGFSSGAVIDEKRKNIVYWLLVW